MNKVLQAILSVLKTDFGYLFTAVSGAFSIVLSEVPDDEIEIMHGAMNVAADSLKAGRTVEETWSDVLNFVARQQLQELSKVAEHLVLAFIHGAAAKSA